MADILDAAQTTTPPPPPVEPPPVPPTPPVVPDEPPIPPVPPTASTDSLIIPPPETPAPEPTTTSTPPPPPPKKKSRLGVLLAGLLLLVITLPIAILAVRQQVEIRSKAATFPTIQCTTTLNKWPGTCTVQSLCNTTQPGTAWESSNPACGTLGCCGVKPADAPTSTPIVWPSGPACKTTSGNSGSCKFQQYCTDPNTEWTLSSTCGPSPAGCCAATSGGTSACILAQNLGCTKTVPPGSDGCIKYTCPLGDTNKDGNCDLRDTQGSQQSYSGAGCPTVSCGNDCCQIEYTKGGKFIKDTCGNLVGQGDYYMMCKELKLNCSTTTPTTTPTAPQCIALKAYKDDVLLLSEGLAALQPGDNVTFVLTPGGASTKARFRVNDGSWTETPTKNGSGQYTWNWTVPTGITSFTIEGEFFDGTHWY